MMDSRHLVDPELLAALDVAPNFELSEAMLPMLREMEFPAPPPVEDGVVITNRVIPGPADAPDLRVVIYTPPGLAPNAPVLLHIHGGGYVIGSPEVMGSYARAYAVAAECIVVSTSYRLSPETYWPGPVEDVYAALLWTHANAVSLGGDPTRLAIGGESAGGGLTAALALWSRDHGGPKLCFQLLVYPMLDDRPPADSYAGQYVWTRPNSVYGWSAFLGQPAGTDAVPAKAVPARVADLAGLPPAYIATGALDLFVEENIEYARRLIAIGVPTELRVVPGAWHGFNGFVPDAAISKSFNADIHRALKAAFDRAASAATPAN